MRETVEQCFQKALDQFGYLVIASPTEMVAGEIIEEEVQDGDRFVVIKWRTIRETDERDARENFSSYGPPDEFEPCQGTEKFYRIIAE